MRGFLDFSNGVFRGVMTIGKIWWLNILWLVCCLPIVTIGASTTALIYACMKLHRDEGYPTGNFFHSFKDNFGQATALWGVYGVIGALLAWALVFWNQTGNQTAWAVTWMLVIPYLASFLYVFAIQAKFVNRVVDTLHFSVLLPFRHLKETILMVVAMGAVIYFNVTTNVAVNVATLVFGAGFLAYIFSVYYINVFDHYIPREPEEEELKTETGDRE